MEKKETDMKENLTAKMHYEFLEEKGVNKRDFFIFAAAGAISRGIPKADALKEYNITEEEYDANIDRILNTDDWIATPYDIACKKAAEEGYDVVNYDREYKGGKLYIALKSKLMNKYAGFPLCILVKERKPIVLDEDETVKLAFPYK